MKSKAQIRKMVIAAMFISLGYFLPFLTAQSPELGSMLLLMHIPVLLCGFICGGTYGLAVGAIVPITRSLILGRPMLFPTAVAMSLELAVYGLLTGILYRLFPKKPVYIYISLITAMLGGRAVWGAASAIFAGMQDKAFGLAAFWTGGFVTALPGIVIQIILIPSIIFALERAKLMPKN